MTNMVNVLLSQDTIDKIIERKELMFMESFDYALLNDLGDKICNQLYSDVTLKNKDGK